MSQWTLFAPELPAKVSLSPDLEREWLRLTATWPSSFLNFLASHARHGWSGRMCPELCPVGRMRRQIQKDESGKVTILIPSSVVYSRSGTGSPIEFLTLKTSASPSNVKECSLSDILEDSGNVPQRYYLTPKACAGILRRCQKRGRSLPLSLQTELKRVAQMTTKPRQDI